MYTAQLTQEHKLHISAVFCQEEPTPCLEFWAPEQQEGARWDLYINGISQRSR